MPVCLKTEPYTVTECFASVLKAELQPIIEHVMSVHWKAEP
jgi:hypothetical protein